jgi:RNA polymerase sigma-70 factor (ECF subfamily)
MSSLSAQHVQAWVADPAEALRTLYVEEREFLRAAIARLAGPAADVDDLLQEVFIVALRRPSAVLSAQSARAWLYGAAVKIACSWRRRNRWARFLGLQSAAHVPTHATPAGALDKADARERVQAIVDRLSDRKRTVFVLFELEGLSGDEIALAVGCPVKTVWTRLHHARREFLVGLERERVRLEREAR